MKVVFSELALTDLESIANYLLENAGLETTLGIIDQIHYTIEETIFDNPKIGVVVNYLPDHKIRFFPANKTSYNIYYKPSVSEILIVRVLHERRNIRKILTG